MSDMLKASVEKLKNDYLRGEYELDEFIEILTKQSKQDEVNDNPHLGYKTALVPDELLKPQPQEKQEEVKCDQDNELREAAENVFELGASAFQDCLNPHTLEFDHETYKRLKEEAVNQKK
jgi:hypothetical protein